MAEKEQLIQENERLQMINKELSNQLTQEKLNSEMILQNVESESSKNMELIETYNKLQTEFDKLKDDVRIHKMSSAISEKIYGDGNLLDEIKRRDFEIQLLWEVVSNNITDKQKLLEIRNEIDIEIIKRSSPIIETE